MSGHLKVRGEWLLAPEARRAPAGHLVEVSVAAGRVAAVEEVPEQAPGGPVPVLGGSGRWLVPGLVNTHTHLAMTLLRGSGPDLPLERWLREAIWPKEEGMTAEDVYWGTLLGIAEGVASGTTWFADMYLARAAEAQCEAFLEAGVRGDVAVGLAGEGASFRAALDRAVAVARAYHGSGEGRLRVRLGPHAPYTCPPPSLRQVAEAAERDDLGLHIHLSETEAEVTESLRRHGQSPVQVAAEAGVLQRPVVAAHVVHPLPEDLPLLAGVQGGVAHCPGSNLWLGAGVAPTVDLVQAGVRLSVGTDGSASAPGLDLWQALRLAWLLPKGTRRDPSRPKAAEVLRWGTADGAAVLGVPEGGQIGPGAPADLVVLRLTEPPHVPAAAPEAQLLASVGRAEVEAVLVAGRPIYRQGEYLTLDRDRILWEVSRRAERLTGRLTARDRT